MIGIGRIVSSVRALIAEHKSGWVRVISGLDRELGCSVCIAVIPAQHGSERYVLPPTLFDMQVDNDPATCCR